MACGAKLMVLFLICADSRADDISNFINVTSNGQLYWLSTWAATYIETKQQCANIGANLTLFKNNNEYNTVYNQLVNHFNQTWLTTNDIWVDLRTTDNNKDNRYEVWWEEELVNVWDLGQPNDNCATTYIECCAMIHIYYGLRDRKCYYKYNFLCTPRDECQEGAHNCSWICQDQVVGFTCACNRGYQLASNGMDCDDVNECNITKSPQTCQQGCLNTRGSYTCWCLPGFTLQADRSSCRDVNECQSTPAPCQQLCDNIDGSFTCRCHVGYVLSSDMRTCTDIDECSLATTACTQGCANTPGSYRCLCPSGYNVTQADPSTCVDVDECQDATNRCSQVCHNTDGSYFCSCLAGYDLDTTNITACVDIDECAQRPNLCDHKCVNQPGSYVCSCPSGFHVGRDGHSCQQTMSYCPCLCSPQARQTTVTHEALQQKMRQLSKNLTVASHDLSAYIRAKTSAPDVRPTSQTFGLFGSVLMGSVLAIIVALDGVRLFVFVYQRVRPPETVANNQVVTPS